MNLAGEQPRDHNDSRTPRGLRMAGNTPGPAKGAGQTQMPRGRTWLWFFLVLLTNYLLVRLLIPSPEAAVTVPYTLFKEEVGKGKVKAIYSQGETITGRFAAPVPTRRLAKRVRSPAACPKR